MCRLHHFNVAASKGEAGSHFNIFIYRWVACEFTPGGSIKSYLNL